MDSIETNSALKNLLSGAKKVFQKKFLYDVLKTFIGVILAFWVNEWKTQKQSSFSERTALTEIQKELTSDLKDLEGNLKGHKDGLKSVRFFWNALEGKAVRDDSLFYDYNFLLRNFTSIQHSAAYEYVKSRGLEIIKDDSLRVQIVNLFDFDFEATEKLEEHYAPHDFFKFYFDKFNEKFSPYFHIDSKGKWTFARPLSEMPEKDKQLVKIWLFRLMVDRVFMINQYEDVISKAKALKNSTDTYLSSGASTK